MKERYRYITAYLVRRRYGGPEEGGWWYNCYEVEKTVNIPKVYQKNSKRALKKVYNLRDTLEAECSHLKWGNIYHTTGGVVVDVIMESVRHENETIEKPYYC